MKKLMLLCMLVMLVASACSKDQEEVYIYNWSEYMPDSVLDKFEKETGIKVIYSTYDSNELMYSKIKLQQGSGYDLIVPSTYYIQKMAQEGLLHEIDHSKLTNLHNTLPHLLDPEYDRGNKYSVPYMWGASIIGYNEKIVKSELTSWADLWKPEFKGKVLLQNDMREVFQMALMLLGYDGNSSDPIEIEAAYTKLQELVPNVLVFNSDSPKQPFISEEVAVGLIWTGEAYNAMQANPNIRFAYPKEGAILWVDCISIPAKAKNIDNAYKFIDFIMRPDIAMEIAEDVGYSTPNKAALELMPTELRQNELMNPSAKNLKNAQYQNNIGEAILIYEKYWERLKTGK